MFSTSVRHFLISDDDEIFRVSNAKFARLLRGSSDENTERFAGKRVRAAEIAVRLENRKPVKVIRTVYYYLHFKEKGILDYDRFMKDGVIVLDAYDSIFDKEKNQDNVINAKKEFAKRKRDYSVWWKPDMQLERNILDASIDEFECRRL